jgi:two-component system, LytTR family, response regulator
MIKAIIVDDEAKSRITLRDLVNRHCSSVEVVELCSSVDSALLAIEKHAPHLVFLDIEMPNSNGFSLLEKSPGASFEVIFTTAYDHYAIRAIKFSAMDYLLKPIDVDELKEAVSKFENKSTGEGEKLKKVELLLSNLKGRSAKIAVPTFDGLQMVNAEDIIRCTANESYTEITLIGGKKIMVSRLLKDYEDLLGEYNFFRIHNSCLINLIHVVKYIKGDGGYVVMTDNETCEVSRRKKTELLNRLSLLHL